MDDDLAQIRKEIAGPILADLSNRIWAAGHRPDPDPDTVVSAHWDWSDLLVRRDAVLAAGIKEALDACDGRVKEAAKLLGINRMTFYHWRKRLGV